MATITFGLSRSSLTRPLASLRQGLVAIVEVLFLWQRRADERLWLGQLDDHMLKDVGLNRVDVAREAGKPFWKG